MNELSELLRCINYQFKDINLLKRALTHSSFGKSEENYEKLEFVGDRVLGLVISMNIFNNFKMDSEGELAKKLAFLVCKDTLKKVASRINLHKYLRVSKELNSSSIESIKANSLEALIAAIYLDSNLKKTEEIINRLWKEEIDGIDLSNHDPKSRLQEWCLKKDNKLPEYEFISKEGPEHEPIFTISVKHKKNFFAVGKGKNKQDAEINAASILLKEIEKNK